MWTWLPKYVSTGSQAFIPNLDFYVYYTLQVLSETVSKGLKLTGGEEASETAHFVGMVDKFFDTLNVRNYTHGIYSRKRF